MAKRILDSFSRTHDYLRISLTEKCSLRCRYCMPPEGVHLSKPDQLLSVSEITRVSKILAEKRALRKIRLTGGEPLIRKEIYEIVSNLNELRSHSVETIGITTNGVALTQKRANQLFESGLDTANISIDTLEPLKAEFVTRRPSTFHKRALQSIENALSAGLKVKVNCVLQRDLNFDEIVPLVELSRHQPISVRFIEFMPFNGNDWSGGKKFVSMREILRVVTEQYGEIEFIQGEKSDVAKKWKIDGFKGNFGIIGSMSTPFCSGCNRIRLTANGRIKTCLFSNEEDDFDLRSHLRSDANDDQILDLIEKVMLTKKASHGGMDYLVENRDKNRPMTSIGG